MSNSSNGAQAISNSVPVAASRVPGVRTVATVYSGDFLFRHSVSGLTAVSAEHLSDTVILQMDSGTGPPALRSGQLLIDTTTANSDHLTVGSVVPVKFAQTGNSTMRDRRNLQAQRAAGQLPGE